MCWKQALQTILFKDLTLYDSRHGMVIAFKSYLNNMLAYGDLCKLNLMELPSQ